MAVLVTGGAGYIGSHMALSLIETGRDVVVLDNLTTGFRWAVPAEAVLIEGDCGDPATVASILNRFQISAVVHFAGSIVVPDSIQDPLGYYLNNTVKSRTLIACSIEAGIRHFIFSSSAAVYGEPDAVPIPEDAPLAPISPYGSSKLMTEIMLRDAARAHDLSYAILRYFNVAGADPLARAGQSSPRATHLIKVASEAALGRRPVLEIFGDSYQTSDGTCVRDYIHVADLAHAHLLALDHLEQRGESLTVNCGYGRGYTVREVVEAVQRISGVDFPVRLAPPRPGDPAALVAQADRIRTELSWRPLYDDLETIVTHALAWERKLNARQAPAA
jgi:UDP-glucose 4-epimerase